MATTELSTLITALRVETEKNSISPENVGYLIQLVYEYTNSQYSSLQNSFLGITDHIQKLDTNMTELQSLVKELREFDLGVTDHIQKLDTNMTELQSLVKELREFVLTESDNWVIL